MRKILAIAVILVLLVVVTAFTGCTDDSRTKIDGVLVNETDQRVYIVFLNDVTDEEFYMGVGANRSLDYKVSPGQYTITGYYYSGDDYIDSTDLNIKATDDTYAIIVRETSVSAWSS